MLHSYFIVSTYVVVLLFKLKRALLEKLACVPLTFLDACAAEDV